jgi:flagellar motor protein MotB
MAGKGGGSWKVAYADFVTAMMAFFLVMWIGAQDVKVRQSVANYFVDPSGVSKAPKTTGAVMDAPDPGSVSADAGVSKTQGTRAAANGPPSPSTKAVMDWISTDQKRAGYWKQKAQQARAAANAQQAANDNLDPDKRAAVNLTNDLRAELTKNIPDGTPEVYRDLIFGSFREVNWEQVADHILNYGG